MLNYTKNHINNIILNLITASSVWYNDLSCILIIKHNQGIHAWWAHTVSLSGPHLLFEVKLLHVLIIMVPCSSWAIAWLLLYSPVVLHGYCYKPESKSRYETRYYTPCIILYMYCSRTTCSAYYHHIIIHVCKEHSDTVILIWIPDEWTHHIHE